MHKVFLTEEECSIIQGAQEIVEVFGGFPSMENGELLSIEIKAHKQTRRYDVALLFDLSGWFEACSFHAKGGKGFFPYPDIQNPPFTKIKLLFEKVEGINVNDIAMSICGEIKFTNKPDYRTIVQDEHPSTTPRIPRPFCGFGIRYGSQMFISFFEEEVIISASFV